MAHQTPSPTRRRLLQYGGAVPLSLAMTPGCAFAQQAKIPTARDYEGLFYVANVPVVSNLNRHGKTGEVMRIQGRVMNAADSEEPVSGARLELWQTDGLGRYYPQNNGDYSDYKDDEVDMRGTVITDAEGRFDVMSLFPAAYAPRPPHIHYWVHSDGFRSLVTQHYLDTSPRNRPYRTAKVDRSQTPALFKAPTIYIEPV